MNVFCIVLFYLLKKKLGNLCFNENLSSYKILKKILGMTNSTDCAAYAINLNLYTIIF